MKPTLFLLISLKVSLFSFTNYLLGHRVWGPKGEKSKVVSATSLGSSFSLTALMALNESMPVILDLRENTNTQVCLNVMKILTLLSLILCNL